MCLLLREVSVNRKLHLWDQKDGQRWAYLGWSLEVVVVSGHGACQQQKHNPADDDDDEQSGFYLIQHYTTPNH